MCRGRLRFKSAASYDFCICSQSTNTTQSYYANTGPTLKIMNYESNSIYKMFKNIYKCIKIIWQILFWHLDTKEEDKCQIRAEVASSARNKLSIVSYKLIYCLKIPSIYETYRAPVSFKAPFACKSVIL